MRWLFILLVLPTASKAMDKMPTCREVRVAVVTAGGAASAEAIARSMGVSEEYIAYAKQCLKRPSHSVSASSR